MVGEKMSIDKLTRPKLYYMDNEYVDGYHKTIDRKIHLSLSGPIPDNAGCTFDIDLNELRKYSGSSDKEIKKYILSVVNHPNVIGVHVEVDNELYRTITNLNNQR